MAFGLTTEGFNPARLDDVRQAITDDLVAAFGQNIQTGSDSVFGQIIGLFSERFADLWEAAEDVYTAAYIGSATDKSLDDLVALAGIFRRGATFSVVVLTLSGTPTTVIPAGSIVEDPITGTQWITADEAIIGAGGTITVNASPENTGAVIGLSGTITEIVTPVTGWDSVTNALDAVVGRTQETDASLRTRFILSFRIGGGSSDEAIRAVLLNLTGVTEAFVVSNRSDEPDAEGRPPNSFEVIVRGGTDQDIFDAIWVSGPAGIRVFGLTTGTVIDSVGNSQPSALTRPLAVDIYVEVEYEVDDNPPEDIEALTQAEILEFASSFITGQDVVPFKFVQNIETTGFLSLIFKVGFFPNPTSNDPLTISPRQLASFDSSRINFVRTN